MDAVDFDMLELLHWGKRSILIGFAFLGWICLVLVFVRR